MEYKDYMNDHHVPPPLPLSYSTPLPSSPVRPLTLVAIAGTTILAGAVIGASTNAVNGAVSPTYFVNILGWQGVSDVWRASIAQGIFEGFVYGILFAITFTLAVGIITRATCTFGPAFRCLLMIVATTYACCVAGGLIAMGLAALSPEFYRKTFIGVPREFGPMLRYAWVGGSIWGAEFGGLLSLAIGLVLFRAKWKRHSRS